MRTKGEKIWIIFCFYFFYSASEKYPSLNNNNNTSVNVFFGWVIFSQNKGE